MSEEASDPNTPNPPTRLDPGHADRAAITQLTVDYCWALDTGQWGDLRRVFTPDAVQIARARRIIETFERADTGLVVIDGKLIEKPVLRDMHRIVALAERISA